MNHTNGAGMVNAIADRPMMAELARRSGRGWTRCRSARTDRGPQREMGPPCGRPHSHRRVVPPKWELDAWRLDAAPTALASLRSASHRPALAPAPVPSGAGIDREDHPLPPGGSETGLVDPGLKRLPLCPKAPRNPRHRAGKSGLSDFAPSRLQRSGIRICSRTNLCAFLVSFLDRAASRHRVDRGSKIPSSSPAFRPLSRKGQSPFRCLEGALPDRFGQARDRPSYPLSAILPVDKGG